MHAIDPRLPDIDRVVRVPDDCVWIEAGLARGDRPQDPWVDVMVCRGIVKTVSACGRCGRREHDAANDQYMTRNGLLCHWMCWIAMRSFGIEMPRATLGGWSYFFSVASSC